MKKLFTFLLILSFFGNANIVLAAHQIYQSISPAVLLKPYKDISMKILVIKKLKQQAKNLSQTDKNIISKYVFGAVKSENTFLLINSYLRGNLTKYISKNDISKPLEMRLKMYSDNLSSAISKGRLPQNMLLYYSIDNKTFVTFFPDKTLQKVIVSPVSAENEAVLKSKICNKKYKDNGFMLSSYDKSYTEKTKFRFEIKAPKNLQALLIDEICSQNKKQIIINKGYDWKVTDVKKAYDTHQKQDFYLITLKIVL